MIDNNIEISKMSLEDFNDIKESLVSEFDNFWNPETLENELKNENSYYIVAKINKIEHNKTSCLKASSVLKADLKPSLE